MALIVVGVVILSGAWLGRDRVLRLAGHWLNVGESPRRCDYIMVLPGGEETRPFVAAAMVKSGEANTVLIPRVGTSPDVNNGTRRLAHEVIRDVLVHRGVPPGNIAYIGAGSTNTFTDALALREHLAGRTRSTVTVVTSDFHTRRARWIFGRVLPDRRGEIYFVAAPDDRVDEASWWQSRETAWGRLSEYGKLTAYLCIYEPWTRIGAGVVLSIAISFSIALWRRNSKCIANRSGALPS